MILLDPRVERQITADVAERRYFLETIEAPENFTDRAIKKKKKRRFQRKWEFRKFQNCDKSRCILSLCAIVREFEAKTFCFDRF